MRDTMLVFAVAVVMVVVLTMQNDWDDGGL
jgi:hypothetical protein